MIFLHLIPPSWWMRLFQRLVKPSWRAGLGLDSLMGRAVCKGVSRGGCGLRMSLGSLSSDGWGCAACLLSHFSCVQLFATPARLLCPWASPGKDTGVGCHFLLQGIFPTQRSYPRLLCLLHWQVGSIPLASRLCLPSN